jgi:hypothetical protein
MKKFYIFNLFTIFFIIGADGLPPGNEEMTVWSNGEIVYYIKVKPGKNRTVSCDGLIECNIWKVSAYAKNISKDKIITPKTIFFGPNPIGFESCSFNSQDCTDTFSMCNNLQPLKPGRSYKIATWRIYSINANPSKAEFVSIYEKPVEEKHFTFAEK